MQRWREVVGVLRDERRRCILENVDAGRLLARKFDYSGVDLGQIERTDRLRRPLSRGARMPYGSSATRGAATAA